VLQLPPLLPVLPKPVDLGGLVGGVVGGLVAGLGGTLGLGSATTP
jgi:predicted lipid-binding transport protein (Tim44 family)